VDEVKNIAKATIGLLTVMVLVSKVADHFLQEPPALAGRGNRDKDSTA
jgi:hypothetical protein